MADEKCILDPQRDCLGLQKANMLEKQMSEWKEQSRQTHKEFFDRIRGLEKAQEDSKDFHAKFYDWQRQQIARDARLDEKLNGMDANIKKVLAKQESCELKPAKRWDAIVDKAIWAVLAAVIAFLLARIGL